MKKHSSIPIHNFHVSDDDRPVSFRLVKLETKTDYIASEPHRHAYYEIFIFNEGSGTHMIDFENIEIRSNSIHFVSPGQVHMVRRGIGSNGYVLLFSREFFYFNTENKNMLLEFPFLDNPTAKTFLNISQEQAGIINHLAGEISREFSSRDPFKEDILRSYITILLLKCKAWYEAAGDQQRPETAAAQLVQSFRILVEEQFIRHHKVNDYAKLLSITPNHLNEATKKIAGQTASELIQDRILLEAKRLLLHSNLASKEVAYTIGFNDPSYFSRFFRTNTGFSPETFRSMNREKYLKK